MSMVNDMKGSGRIITSTEKVHERERNKLLTSFTVIN